MTIQNIITSHRVANREREMALELFKAIEEGEYQFEAINNFFDATTYHIQGNLNSGHVFAIDENYMCLMMNGDCADLFLNTPYDGHEGFITDLLSDLMPSDLNSEDVEFLLHFINELSIDISEFQHWKKEKGGQK